MKNPRVSILMPIYNVAPYLREAMDSMLNQTFTDFELICLDDCSPDNSAEIVDSYNDPRIVRYRGEKNVGLANILNEGLDMARGEYIARMDSDDISLPNRLQVQVDYLDNHPEIDLCSCGMQLFGDRDEIWVRDADPEKVKVTALFFSPILHASSMWRKERFGTLRFRQEMFPAEDYDLWTRAIVHGLRLVNLPNVLYRYRIFGTQQATAQIERSEAKCREIRENYVRMMFPNATEDLVYRTINLGNMGDVWDVKHVVEELIKKNSVTGMFSKKTLVCQLWKYYQSRVLDAGHWDKSFWDLTIRQQFRLLRMLIWR